MQAHYQHGKIRFFYLASSRININQCVSYYNPRGDYFTHKLAIRFMGYLFCYAIGYFSPTLSWGSNYRKHVRLQSTTLYTPAINLDDHKNKQTSLIFAKLRLLHEGQRLYFSGENLIVRLWPPMRFNKRYSCYNIELSHSLIKCTAKIDSINLKKMSTISLATAANKARHVKEA